MNEHELVGEGCAGEGRLLRVSDRCGWKRQILIAAVIGLIAVALCLSAMGAWSGWAADSFTYLKAARALACTDSLPAERLVAPPGAPVVFAMLVAWFGDVPILAIRWMQALCLTAVAMMTFYLHRRELGERLAVVAGVFVASSVVLLQLTITPLSEPLFLMLLCVWLLLMQRWEVRGPIDWTEAALGGMLCSALFFVRSMGILVVPLSMWVLWRDKRIAWRSRIGRIGILATCTIGPWLAWELRQSQWDGPDNYRRALLQPSWIEDSSVTGMSAYSQRIVRFGQLRLDSLKELFVAPNPFWRLYTGPFQRPSSWLIGGGIVAICGWRLWRYQLAMDAYVLGTLALLAIWPYDEGVRLVAPLAPVVLAYPLMVGRRLFQSGRVFRPANEWGLRQWGVTAAFLILMIVQMGGLIQWELKVPQLREKNVALFKSMEELAAWQKTNLAPNGAYLGITPALDNNKLLLAGASYLAQRTVRPIDIIQGKSFDVSLNGVDAALVDRKLQAAAAACWHSTGRLAAGPFVIFKSHAFTTVMNFHESLAEDAIVERPDDAKD